MKRLLNKVPRTALVAGTALAMNAGMALAQNPAYNVSIGGAKGYATDLGVVITGALQIIMAIAAILVFMYLIWGAVQWITSGGDKGKTEEARNKITAAVIGLIVLAASYAILLVVLKFLGFNGLSGAVNQVEKLPGTKGETI